MTDSDQQEPEQPEPAPGEPDKPRKQYPITGARLGAKAIVAAAMLERGDSYRTIRKETGLSMTSIAALKYGEAGRVLDPRHVKAVRERLPDKLAVLTDQAINAITPDKLKAAGPGELSLVASRAASMAGLKQPDRMEHFHAVMLKFSQDEPAPLIIQENTKHTD